LKNVIQGVATTYNELQWHLKALLTLLKAMDDRSSQHLYNDKRIQSYANAVMWVCQGPLETDRLKAEHDERGRKQQCHNLEPDVYTQGESGVSVVESSHEDGSWYDEEEGDGGEDTVGSDERLVASHVAKAIAHA
jgi:hypothetical protein